MAFIRFITLHGTFSFLLSRPTAMAPAGRHTWPTTLPLALSLMTTELPAFPCPHCHARAFTKRAVESDAPAGAGTVLAHLYVCGACGENYLATVHVAADRTRTETWDYYLERGVALRRARRYVPSGAHALDEVEPLFAIDGRAVSETAWRAALDGLRSAPSPLVAGAADARTLAGRWSAWWSAARPAPALRLVGPYGPARQSV